MFILTYNLQKITFGEHFSFYSDDSTTDGAYIFLEKPHEVSYNAGTGSYDYHIEGADGYWYTRDYTKYSPTEIPNNTAETYYASILLVDEVFVLIKNGTLRDIANAVRTRSGATDKYQPNELASIILNLE